MNSEVVSTVPLNRRILLVDDNNTIHDDFRKILARPATADTELDVAAAEIFGQSLPVTVDVGFQIDSAHQGEEAWQMVQQAMKEGRPYAMAFVDMRMPPGWDGLTTIGKLWEVDPEINAVICTAYSDRSWDEIQTTLTARDRWLVLKKPFDKIEVVQLAHALTEKWTLSRLAALKRDSLERMVQARTVELSNAHRVSSEFLACASHELLTPLNGISGFLGVLNESGLTDEQLDFVQEASKCSDRLLCLIRRILDFNQLEAGTLDLRQETFSPLQLLQVLCEENAAVARTLGVELRVDASALPSPRWVAPAQALRKALTPLLENALKFTTQGAITLGVRSSEGQLELSVTDTGVGLTPEQEEWIRIPFAQVDGGITRRNAGIGLGLPLARRLVKAMGGEFHVSGKPNQGVTVRFTINASEATAQDAAA